MKAARITFTVLISFAVLLPAYGLTSSSGHRQESTKPAVQYDDTDIAPPLPDSPDSTDPLFDDPDEMTEINEPDSYGEEPAADDSGLQDDPDSGDINPAE